MPVLTPGSYPNHPQHPFVHLHVHSTYSDGLATPDDLACEAQGHGQAVLALTDHNTLEGCAPFVAACAARGIVPLPGAEVHAATRDGRRGHVLVLPAHAAGYAKLAWLIRRARTRGRTIQVGELAGIGLVTSACAGGHVAGPLLRVGVGGGDYWGARDAARELRDTLGPSFHLEVQQTFGPAIAWVLTIGRELGIPTLVTNDVHYLRAQDAERHGQPLLHLAPEGQMHVVCALLRCSDAMEAAGAVAHDLAKAARRWLPSLFPDYAPDDDVVADDLHDGIDHGIDDGGPGTADGHQEEGDDPDGRAARRAAKASRDVRHDQALPV